MNSEQQLQPHGRAAWVCLVCFRLVLRQSWDKDLFMNKTGGAILANEKDALHSESIQESFGVTVEKLDQVLKDPCFWGHVHLIRSWTATLSFLNGCGPVWAVGWAPKDVVALPAIPAIPYQPVSNNRSAIHNANVILLY